MRIIVLLLSLSVASQAFCGAAQYDFGVFLDGKRIGEHRFVVEELAEGRYAMQSNARFDVKVLFVPVYRYRHAAEEIWEDGCLQSISSRTTVNGRESELRGRLQSESFELEVEDAGLTQSRALPLCVSTYAYWDAGTLLRQERLLNSQTGTYEPVTFEKGSGGQVAINGERFVINLDYDANQWRGLSTLRDGRKLEYRLENTEGTLL